MTHDEVTVEHEFVPCPLCKQYSHSIGEGELAAAFNVFQSMFSHRNDGIPTQFCFDEKARDAAQVLMAAAVSATKPAVEGECPTCQGRGDLYAASPHLPRSPEPQQCDDCQGTGRARPVAVEGDELVERLRADADYLDDQGECPVATDVREAADLLESLSRRMGELEGALAGASKAMSPLAKYYELNDQRDGNLEVPVRELGAVLRALNRIAALQGHSSSSGEAK